MCTGAGAFTPTAAAPAPNGINEGRESAIWETAAADDSAAMAQKKATPAPVTPYEMPFPCGETWTGSTRRGHSPSERSVDFNYPGGDLGKPVIAAAGGVVTKTVVGRKKPGYGQYVVVDHGNNESSLYAHLDSVLVSVGQPVQAGSPLGTVGSTGNASGSHLHFEERIGTEVVDAWFSGVKFPMNSTQASRNCGQAIVDTPLAGDMYGDKAAELIVFRRASPAAFRVNRNGIKERVIKIGSAYSQPILGDWDGNGRVDPGVRDPKTRVFTLKVKKQKTKVKFGKVGDVPVAGNWDGVGGWEVGIWRPARARFILKMADGSKQKVPIGDSDDLPVTGDWDGDGITDVGVYDSATATFTLLGPDAQGQPATTVVQFGSPGDVPVVGDWDGDGITDLGVWTPSTATFTKREATVPAEPSARVSTVVFGQPVR